jgi:hypothetical protein
MSSILFPQAANDDDDDDSPRVFVKRAHKEEMDLLRERTKNEESYNKQMLRLKERKSVAFEAIARSLELIATAYAFGPGNEGYLQAKADFDENVEDEENKKRKLE